MLALKVRLPRTELRPYVRTFVQREVSLDSSMLVMPTTAQLEQILMFDFGIPTLAAFRDGPLKTIEETSAPGAQTRFACHMHLRGGVEAFGIFFSPTAFVHLFGIPSRELTDTQGDAEGMVGNTVRALWNRLGETSSFEERVLIAEEFLIYRATRAKPGSTIVA